MNKARLCVLGAALMSAGLAMAQGMAPALVSTTGGRSTISLRDAGHVDDSDRQISNPWPFTANRVQIYCASNGVAVMQAGFAVAALNGYTSGLARQMHLRDGTGQERNIIGTSDNRLLKTGGAVVPNASDPDIGEWSGFLLKKALTTCG